MSVLAEKIRKSRESSLEVGAFVFTIRRPTDVEMMEWGRVRRSKDLLAFVVGWDRVRELDLFPGGEGHPAVFDSEACVEWLSDRDDLFGPVVNAVLESYRAHKARLEDAAKN